MDRLSLKILKYLKKQKRAVSRSTIINLYGERSVNSLNQLEHDSFVLQGQKFGGTYKNTKTDRVETYNVPNGMYVVAPLGLDFLQHKFIEDFDKWVTRICAIVGAVTGIVSLVMHFI